MQRRLLAIVLSAGVASLLPSNTYAQAPREQIPVSSVRGMVVAGDTGRPLSGVRVTLSAPELSDVSRNTTTDDSGRYEINDLPAGQYVARATRSGFLTTAYGARRPFDPAQRFRVGDRDAVRNIDFSLPRLGLISGRITDEAGEPVEGVTVVALRSRFGDGRRQLSASGRGSVQTDDAGQYRIAELPPGTYYVLALTRDTWTVIEDGIPHEMGFAPTYFPGTTTGIGARRVSVGVGAGIAAETRNIDVPLVAGRTLTVSGIALDDQNNPFETVALRGDLQGEEFSSAGGAKSAAVAGDGSFTFTNVLPGAYTLVARAGRESDHPQVAILPVMVDGADLTGVTLNGAEGGIIEGRIVTESGEPADVPGLTVGMGLPGAGQGDPAIVATLSNAGSNAVSEGGTFAVRGVFGRARLRVTLPDGWRVKSIRHGGRDITDAEIELRSRETMSGVQVVVTTQTASITGRVTNDRGTPLSDGTVVVFADESARWVTDPRGALATNPDQRGLFQIDGLAPGSYRAVALDYIQDGMWNDPEFLEALRRYAPTFTVADGGSYRVTLRLQASESGR